MDSDSTASTTKVAPLGRALMTEQGQTGTYVMGGIITLEEYNPKLINRRGIEQYDIMRLSDPTVHAALIACKLPIRGAKWDVKPASEDALDKEAADFVKRELMDRNVNWEQLIAEVLTVFDFGFSLFEKTYEKTTFNGKTMVGLESLEFRKQRSIMKWETLEGKPGVYQILQTGGASIDEEKLLLFTNEREGDNYQGRSVLRYAYKPWHMKHNLETIAAVGIERLAIGVPVLMPPPTPESEDVTAARQFLREFRANSQQYMELPAGWNVEMMDMKANSTKDALPFINYCSVNIMKSVLAQFLELSTSTSSSSRALSEDHSQLFEKSLEAMSNIIAGSFNQNFVQQLCDLNWAKGTLKNGYPEVTFANMGDEALTEMAAYISALTGGGVLTPDPDLENHLRTIARLPALPEDLEDPKAYADRETVQTAIQNTQLGMMTDPALAKTPPNGKQPSAQQGKPVKPPVKPGAKADALSELKAYRQDLIARVMADDTA